MSQTAAKADEVNPGISAPLLEPMSLLGAAMTSANAHIAYVTNNTEGALPHFEALGIGPWKTLEMPLEGNVLRVSFAYMTGRMFEIVEPRSDAQPHFPRPVGNDLAIALHHVGAHIDVDSQLIVDAATTAGLACHRITREAGDIVFVDTRKLLGHWLEVLCFANARYRT